MSWSVASALTFNFPRLTPTFMRTSAGAVSGPVTWGTDYRHRGGAGQAVQPLLRDGVQLQLETALALRDRISSLNLELRSLDSIESQIKGIQRTAKDQMPDEVNERLDALLEKIEEQKTSMVRDPEGGYTSSTRILGKLTGWLSGITRTEAAPTRHQLEYIETLRDESQEALESSRAIVSDDVTSLNETLRAHGLPIVYVGRDQGEGR